MIHPPTRGLWNCGESTAADKTAAVLRTVNGAVAAIPTETVYGLVCNAADAEAVENIYLLKDRDRSKKFTWFIEDWRRMDKYGAVITPLARRLAEKYMPGPITLIVPLQAGGTIGFRIPDHPFCLELLRKTGFPLASTSANHSGQPNALTLDAALDSLTGPVAAAVDGGPISAGALASTVVLATGNEPVVLRQGIVKIEL